MTLCAGWGGRSFPPKVASKNGSGQLATKLTFLYELLDRQIWALDADRPDELAVNGDAPMYSGSPVNLTPVRARNDREAPEIATPPSE